MVGAQRFGAADSSAIPTFNVEQIGRHSHVAGGGMLATRVERRLFPRFGVCCAYILHSAAETAPMISAASSSRPSIKCA